MENLQRLTFNELNSLAKSINYKIAEKGGNHLDEESNMSLSRLNYLVLTELNYKSYEEKLDKRNRPNLGPISRMKYNKLKSLSEIILPDNIFQSKDKFKSLNKILQTK